MWIPPISVIADCQFVFQLQDDQISWVHSQRRGAISAFVEIAVLHVAIGIGRISKGQIGP